MSGRYWRATIDFTVIDPDKLTPLVRALKQAKGDTLNNEELAKKVEDMILLGQVEIDGISDVEAH